MAVEEQMALYQRLRSEHELRFPTLAPWDGLMESALRD